MCFQSLNNYSCREQSNLKRKAWLALPNGTWTKSMGLRHDRSVLSITFGERPHLTEEPRGVQTFFFKGGGAQEIFLGFDISWEYHIQRKKGGGGSPTKDPKEKYSLAESNVKMHGKTKNCILLTLIRQMRREGGMLKKSQNVAPSS